MTKIRYVKGNITNIVGGKTKIFANEIEISSNKNINYHAPKHSYKEPEDPPHIQLLKKYFIKGWWSDNKDRPIKKAYIGDTIKFHLETKNINDNEEINFTIYDWDGMLYRDDKLSLVINGTSNSYNKIKIKSNKGVIEWVTGTGTQKLIEEEGDNEIELYLSCSYKGEIIELPNNTEDYLIIYEKEVKVTVFIELPHSKETGWGAKGLAGHSAMAIGERYFDYGPNNSPGTYSESQYDVDFNKDGDKNDFVRLDAPSFKNSPGQPWWGTHIAQRKKIKPEQVTLNMVLDHIKLYWDDILDPTTGNITHEGTFIYGKVHTVEFYVKESEANKMIKWWEERYSHLKVYSVFPWTGEQCTTTVKTAIQQAFPNLLGSNYVTDTTQTPQGLLEELRSVISTSKEHSGELTKITIIKNEAIDYH